MQQIEVYAAMKNSDMTEGRGPMVVIANFSHRDDAIRAAKGFGVMGCGDGDVEKKIITIYKSYDEFIEATAGDTKRRALAKLSSEEKRVLGLI